jgi:hypothetical protein
MSIFLSSKKLQNSFRTDKVRVDTKRVNFNQLWPLKNNFHLLDTVFSLMHDILSHKERYFSQSISKFKKMLLRKSYISRPVTAVRDVTSCPFTHSFIHSRSIKKIQLITAQFCFFNKNDFILYSSQTLSHLVSSSKPWLISSWILVFLFHKEAMQACIILHWTYLNRNNRLPVQNLFTIEAASSTSDRSIGLSAYRKSIWPLNVQFLLPSYAISANLA